MVSFVRIPSSGELNLHTWLNFTGAIRINDAVCLVFCVNNQMKKCYWMKQPVRPEIFFLLSVFLENLVHSYSFNLSGLQKYVVSLILCFLQQKKVFKLFHEWCKLSALLLFAMNTFCDSTIHELWRKMPLNKTPHGYGKNARGFPLDVVFFWHEDIYITSY